MKNKKIHYHMILDRSGSMGNCRQQTIAAFNSQLDAIRRLQTDYPDQEFTVSLTVFNDFVDQILSHVSGNKVDPLSNNVSEVLARVRSKFSDAVGDNLLAHYNIDGDRGEAKRIALNRELITFNVQ